jgi:hypothetical protein
LRQRANSFRGKHTDDRLLLPRVKGFHRLSDSVMLEVVAKSLLLTENRFQQNKLPVF